MTSVFLLIENRGHVGIFLNVLLQKTQTGAAISVRSASHSASQGWHFCWISCNPLNCFHRFKRIFCLKHLWTVVFLQHTMELRASRHLAHFHTQSGLKNTTVWQSVEKYFIMKTVWLCSSFEFQMKVCWWISACFYCQVNYSPIILQ